MLVLHKGFLRIIRLLNHHAILARLIITAAAACKVLLRGPLLQILVLLLQVPQSPAAIHIIMGIALVISVLRAACPRIAQAFLRLILAAFGTIKVFRHVFILRTTAADIIGLHHAIGVLRHPHHRDFLVIIRYRITGSICDADASFDIVRNEITHLYVIRMVRLYRNIARAIKTVKLAATDAGNAADKINLSARGIDILQNDCIACRIEVGANSILTAVCIIVPISSTLDNPVRVVALDIIICELFALLIAFLNLIYRRIHFFIVIQLQYIVTIAALDNAVDIDIRSVDGDDAAGDNAFQWRLAIIRQHNLLCDIVNIFLFSFQLIIFCTIKALRIVPDIHNAISEGLCNRAAS